MAKSTSSQNSEERVLYLLRHAEKKYGAGDMDIPLSDRGVTQAKMLGKWLAQQDIRFDRILCSPSLRTRETLRLALAETEISTPPSYDEILFNAMPGTNLALVQDINVIHRSVLLVGHNPGIPGLLKYLVDHRKSDGTEALLYQGYPPCTLVKIAVTAAAWKDIQPQDNTLLITYIPEV